MDRPVVSRVRHDGSFGLAHLLQARRRERSQSVHISINIKMLSFYNIVDRSLQESLSKMLQGASVHCIFHHTVCGIALRHRSHLDMRERLKLPRF